MRPRPRSLEPGARAPAAAVAAAVAVFSALAGPLLLFLSVAPPLVAQETPRKEDPRHFQIQGASASLTQEGVFLNLSSATLTPANLEIQVGFRNLLAVTMPSFGVLTPQDYTLLQRKTRKKSIAGNLSASITLVSPLTGIPPRLANAGSVSFPRPDSLEELELSVDGFAPIRFSLTPSSEFTPLAPSERPRLAKEHSLNSSHRDLNVFPLHVTGVRVDEKTVSVDIAFENSSNQSVYLRNSSLSGADAFLIDGHFQRQMPASVSAGLRESIGPTNARWSPGQRQSGTLTFQRPHPHAMRRILLSFPSYESLVLTFDNQARTYKAQVETIGDLHRPPANPLRISGEIHRELSVILSDLTRSVLNNDSANYIRHFMPGSPARAQQMTFLAHMARLPMREFRFHLAEEQALEPRNGGRVDGVNVLVEYSLKFLPSENPFRSTLNCGFVRDSGDGQWRIDRWTFTKQVPFWQLGFTGVTTSDHFYMFYRPGSVSEDKLAKSRRQLEQSYREVGSLPSIRLEDKYVAFLVDREQDFLGLTAKDPLRFHGASSTSYTVRDDRFIALNRAMYINDFQYANSKDRRVEHAREQTITHELVHLALSGDTRHFTPPWLIEGVAVHLAGQLTPGARRVLLESGSLPVLSLSSLSRGKLPGLKLSSAEALNFEYIYSGEAVAYLIRTYGDRRFFDYYRSFAAITPAELDQRAIEQVGNDPNNNAAVPKVMHELTLDLTERHFGVSLYDLDTIVKTNISIRTR